MKKIKRTVTIIIYFFLCYFVKSQTKVGYDYDLNGNRIKRYFTGLRQANEHGPAAVDSALAAPAVPSATANPKTAGELALEHEIRVYPNPTKDLVNVAMSRNGKGEIKAAQLYLIDNNGRVLDSKTHKDAEISFDMSKSPPGNYYLKIVFESGETLSYNIIKAN